MRNRLARQEVKNKNINQEFFVLRGFIAWKYVSPRTTTLTKEVFDELGSLFRRDRAISADCITERTEEILIVNRHCIFS